MLGMVSAIGDGSEAADGREQTAVADCRSRSCARCCSGAGVAMASRPQDYMVAIAVERTDCGDVARLRDRGCRRWSWRWPAPLSAYRSIAVRAAGPQPGRARSSARCLIICSSIAILTTVGIVVSMLFETLDFFQRVIAVELLLRHGLGSALCRRRTAARGPVRPDPAAGRHALHRLRRHAGRRADRPHVAAIYLAEYADAACAPIVKPMLEILAGIPTIVYGFFALVTVGPFLRDCRSLTLAGASRFIQAQSVLTAGLVMGIMLIPFVSSLSDDIITAVPRSLRDGSLGLGATRSETIQQVILPAALPGIVGALLLAASRAIGETMIVVLAAGVAANLTLNPFEAMTTVTVKIVNQLTGDLEFNSPQTLVAFALGLTLFVITLVPQHHRALHRAQVPGAVRMTDAHRRRRRRCRHVPRRRDIGIKQRYAAEKRFRAYGLAAIAIGARLPGAAALRRSVARAAPAFRQTYDQPAESHSTASRVVDPGDTRGNRCQTSTAEAPTDPRLAQDALVASSGSIRADRRQTR